jgi:tetratricopeptide (TPR) repeat protein
LRDQHLACFVNLVEGTAQKPFQKVWPNQGRWLKKELNNLRSALDWALADPRSPRVVDGLRLATALKNFWSTTGMHFEGSIWISKALDLCDKRGLEDKTLRALALEVYGEMVGLQNQKQRAELLLEDSVALFRVIGDDWRLAMALCDLAIWPLQMTKPAFAKRMVAIEESTILARQVGDPLLLGTVLYWKALLERTKGDLENASHDAQESLSLLVETGARGGACYPLVELGAWAIQRGDLAMALRYREDFLRYRQEVEDLNLDWLANDFLLNVSYHIGDYTQMEEIAQKVLDASLGQNIKATIESLFFLGFAYKCQGDYHRAAACFNQSIHLAQEEKYEWGFYYALAGLAALAARMQQLVRAVRLIGLVEKMSGNSYTSPFVFATEVAMLHKALPPEQFSQAWVEGQVMGMEEAFKEGCAIAAELT